MWVATQDLPHSAAHPFYTRLNQILDKADFDGYVETLCQRFYADDVGRPGLPPGRYFRMLLLGYFEGLDSERAITWRAADSLSIRSSLGLEVHEAPPDHSTVSRTRRLIDVETHNAVFTWVLHRLVEAGLVKGKTIGIDATTLEANAALRSIVRRDTGATYQEFLTQLAQASGIETPTREDLARIDRKRPKKGSNDDWTHPLDPDAKITKMKDGRTHLAHKAEHAVDLETGAVVAVTVQDTDEGDTTTSTETLIDAAEHVETVVPDGEIKEVVPDKGYHSNQVMLDLEAVGVRSYISEPDRGRRNWQDNGEARDAVYRNRRRIRGARGKRLLRQRGERLERPCANLYETGRMRRVHLRGHDNIRKRLLVHAGALNLSLLMRRLFGVGTPRGLQDHASALLAGLWVAPLASRNDRHDHLDPILACGGANRLRHSSRATRHQTEFRERFHHGLLRGRQVAAPARVLDLPGPIHVADDEKVFAAVVNVSVHHRVRTALVGERTMPGNVGRRELEIFRSAVEQTFVEPLERIASAQERLVRRHEHRVFGVKRKNLVHVLRIECRFERRRRHANRLLIRDSEFRFRLSSTRTCAHAHAHGQERRCQYPLHIVPSAFLLLPPKGGSHTVNEVETGILALHLMCCQWRH